MRRRDSLPVAGAETP